MEACVKSASWALLRNDGLLDVFVFNVDVVQDLVIVLVLGVFRWEILFGCLVAKC